MVMPADVPLITAEDIEQILHMGRYNTTVVLAPDRNDDGTNVLLVNPPGFIPFAFGVGSFRRHLLLAEEAGATIKVYRSEHVALDIDQPDDLLLYQKLAGENSPVFPQPSAGSLPIAE
jgi:2-phospho-L-lactate guanylyltransferase (CobY/MobA/RfbA family)